MLKVHAASKMYKSRCKAIRVLCRYIEECS